MTIFEKAILAFKVIFSLEMLPYCFLAFILVAYVVARCFSMDKGGQLFREYFRQAGSWFVKGVLPGFLLAMIGINLPPVEKVLLDALNGLSSPLLWVIQLIRG